MTDETRSAEEITAAVLEAVRASVGKYLGRSVPGDPEQTRKWLTEMLMESLELPDDVPPEMAELYEAQKPQAARAGALLLEPFLNGLPEKYEPRKILESISDVMLKMLERRFHDVMDQFPLIMIRYEQLRREGKIQDWGFRRKGETTADVWLIPLLPAEFITIDVKNAGELFDDE